MSDKTLSNTELELTQKIQLHFPRRVISAEVLNQWNGCRAEAITARLTEAFSKGPEIIKPELLLEFIGTITLPAITKKFIARKKFVVNISDDAEVKISYLGDNLKAWLLGKVEEPISKDTFLIQRLRKSSVDGPIIAELGGSAKARIFLGQLWLFLKEKQTKGEKDGWFIAYVEDEIRFPEDEPFAYVNEKGEKVVLRAVYFRWRGDGWDLDADQVSLPIGWSGGSQILSSNSFVAQTK